MNSVSLKKSVAEYVSTTHMALKGLPTEYVLAQIFKPDSLQLTTFGYKCLSTYSKTYRIPIDGTLVMKHYLKLADQTAPFYISGNNFYTFSDELATMLLLTGSVIKYLESGV